MSEEQALELAYQAVQVILMTSLPVLLTALVIGLIIGVIQSVTQVQEMTLSFIPKIIGVFVALLVLLPWIMGKIIAFTTNIFLSLGDLP